MNEILQTTADNLNARGFDAQIFNTADEVKRAVMDFIGEGKTVGIGGSVTVRELGLYEALKDKGNDVAWHWEVMGKPGMDQSLVKTLRYKANASEYYLTSANGVSSQGVLINIDGTGNRLSATLYGPAHVFFIVGRNKIAATFEDAMNRAKNVACVLNAKRLNTQTPCTKAGKCMDCKAAARICRLTAIHEYAPSFEGPRVHVYLVDEDLGY